LGALNMQQVSQIETAPVAACGIAVMAKASIPGHSKTRLVPPLTREEAAACNTAFLRDIVENILAARAEVSVAGYLAFGPPEYRSFFQAVTPAEIGLIEAWHPRFADCLALTALELLQKHQHAILLNCDSPTLPTSVLLESAHALMQPGDRIVFGPARDGGYYLLGLKAKHPRLFEDISWSTEQVARQTLARAAEINVPVHTLPQWYDVDDSQSLKMLASELFEGFVFAAGLRPYSARHTRAILLSLIESSNLQNRLPLPLTLEGAVD
jgi:rSAM/selenodomain-associated transferase 1